MLLLNLFLISLPFYVVCLNNGLGRTPPMGWLSWLRYRCTINCKSYPNDCISENLIMAMADKMALEYKDAGYEYIMIDDCWLAKDRAANGSLLPDPERFPRGMKFLGDYIHSKGLKFGIYEDYGTKTCAGYPGSLGHLKMDAFTFASWGVDYIKFDGCHSVPITQPFGVKMFSDFLNATGRPIFLNVEWPLYMGVNHVTKSQAVLLQDTTNMARVYVDIEDNWNSLLNVINFYKKNNNNFALWAKPGHFNDPDMLLIGNNYITLNQEKLQMTMWSIFAGPLIMSNDLRKISNDSKSILINRNVIAINQDPLGIQGRFIKTIGKLDYWVRPLSSVLGHQQVAIGILNLSNENQMDSFTLQDLNIKGTEKYSLTEVFENQNIVVLSNQTLPIMVYSTSSLFIHCQYLG